MASVSKETTIMSTADAVWEVIGDFETGPSRMAPGHVVGTRVDSDARVVTFADGTVARERFVSRDDDARRIVYTVVGDTLRPDHNNASMQVVADGKDHCRLTWIHDVLPDDLAVPLEAAMSQGMEIIKRTLEARPATEQVA
ncbi:SRPBCC family protein [Streptomyces sp. 6N223]|uniref:SRPBCC family protein n=1 Tax=Streptomyces sp. 6N223 TaxID=3457412 RepID=UPI003FD6898F